jgi:hypothetical protein
MEKPLDFAEKLFQKLFNQPARDVQLGHGSFVTLGFGKDLKTEVIVHKKKEVDIRPEWLFWVYMCFWELEKSNELLATSEDDREKIKKALKALEGKNLINVEILESSYEIQLEFEGELLLSLYTNDSSEDNVQWMLFTPDEMVLEATANQKLLYEKESE